VKAIGVLGSTGSIGKSTLDVIGNHPAEFSVSVLAGGQNVALLKNQIERFHPKLAVVFDEQHALQLKDLLKSSGASILFGPDGYREAASFAQTDMVVSAIVGAAGLIPTLDAISAGKDIALANKETLVMAGAFVLGKASEKGVQIIPVDSEHCAIFQCLRGNDPTAVKRIILTASGGPFLHSSREEIMAAGLSDALRHPNWAMGKKITIDSATMMNKGLEVIEASRLFGLPVTKIDVLIHPQSIVHSMVEYQDGSIIAQLGIPDMRVPISYALSYPNRLDEPDYRLDLAKIKDLTFLNPDFERFPALEMAYRAAKIGGTMPTVLNASNEIAVAAFLAGRIGLYDITDIVEKTTLRHHVKDEGNMEDILQADNWARLEAKKNIEEITN
jgi:1-deoxy-D-xylulose-5-phosphate reductoisomerase